MPIDRTGDISTAEPGLSPQWYAFALLSLAVGAVLRLVWGHDIEFKHDESFMFDRAMNAGTREPFPWVGMASGAGVVNPGMSIWIFIAMAKLSGAQTPPELARVVQVINVGALALSMLFAIRVVEPHERRAWIWAVALACVNPFAVLFDRKIWAQSVLPLFCMTAIICWWKRDTRVGAFGWGLIGAWLGQIHMSGFFLTVSLVVWTMLRNRQKASDEPRVTVHWRSWATGTLVGALTLLPWAWHLVEFGTAARQHSYWGVFLGHNTFGSWFWILWATGALGLGMSYSLGVDEFISFLKYPVILVRPTYAIAAAHVISLAVGAWLLLTRAWQGRVRGSTWRRTLLGTGEPSDQLLRAGLYGLGLMLTAIGSPIHRHYLIVTFPLPWLWLARQMRTATRHWNYLLASLWLSELVISAGFLYYIHVNHGAPSGDFGATYSHPR